jgi:hypothetical protein
LLPTGAGNGDRTVLRAPEPCLSEGELMAKIASELLIERLADWGVDTVFGLPDDGIPNEPPLPGKVAYDQAKNFAQAFLKGQPHKAAIGATLFKDKIEQLGH